MIHSILNFTFRGMNINQLVIWFFIYSFLGWCMECVVIRHQLGYWENRGFAKSPFCIIYGFGLFFAFILFRPIEHNFFALYIAGAICATAFEFLTAQVMLKLFGEVWWNYDHLRFNYKGIICLQSTIGWGFVAVFVFGAVNRFVQNIVFSINHKVAVAISILLIVVYLVDFTYHFSMRIIQNESMREFNSKARNTVKEFFRIG